MRVFVFLADVMRRERFCIALAAMSFPGSSDYAMRANLKDAGWAVPAALSLLDDYFHRPSGAPTLPAFLEFARRCRRVGGFAVGCRDEEFRKQVQLNIYCAGRAVLAQTRQDHAVACWSAFCGVDAAALPVDVIGRFTFPDFLPVERGPKLPLLVAVRAAVARIKSDAAANTANEAAAIQVSVFAWWRDGG